MTDTINREHAHAPPHYVADAGDGCFDETLHADVRADQPPARQALLQVRHFQRPPAQPTSANDDGSPRTDSCSPAASLLDLLHALTATAASNQATTSATASQSPPLEAIQEQLLDYEHQLPDGIAHEMKMDTDSLSTHLNRLNDKLATTTPNGGGDDTHAV